MLSSSTIFQPKTKSIEFSLILEKFESILELQDIHREEALDTLDALFSFEINMSIARALDLFENTTRYYADYQSVRNSSTVSRLEKHYNIREFTHNVTYVITGEREIKFFSNDFIIPASKFDEKHHLLSISLLVCSEKFFDLYTHFALNKDHKDFLNSQFSYVLKSVIKSEYGADAMKNTYFLSLAQICNINIPEKGASSSTPTFT